MLEREPGAKIVYNLICSWTVPEVIREHGGVPVRTRVGHSFIKQVMAETGAIFGGEHSGPLLLPRELPRGLGADRRGRRRWASSRGPTRPLSELLAPFRRYVGVGRDQLRWSTIQQGRIEAIAARYADGRQDRLDGLTVEFDDWWCNVRPSNTEPLLRLNVEARTPELLAEKTAEVLALISGRCRDGTTRRRP